MASPEPAVGVFTPAGTCPGRLRRHGVIGCADPGQNPAAVRSGSSRVRGRGLGRQCRGQCPGARPAAVMAGRRGPASGTTGSDASGVKANPLGIRLATPDKVPLTQGWQPRKGAEGCGKLQVNSLFCKPICKPDAARQLEMGETDPTERDGICPVRRGHRTRERRPETPETHVVWLITQRSRVQIPPPLPSLQVRGLFRSWKGPSSEACARNCAQASEEGRRGGWSVRRAAADIVRGSDGVQLPLRCCTRSSAINCRWSATRLLWEYESADPGFCDPAGGPPGAG